MSFGAFFYLVSVVGAYNLGAYSARNPDGLAQWAKRAWEWLNQERAS